MTIWGAFLLTAIVAVFVLFMYSEAKRMKRETDERINYLKTMRECMCSLESNIRKIAVNFDEAMNEIRDIND